MQRDDTGPAQDALGGEAERRIQSITERWPTRMSALTPCLWAVQDALGWVPPQAVDRLIEVLDVPRRRIHEVLTHQSMLRTEPPARFTLQFCQGICCTILGSLEMIAHTQKRLGIRIGQTTPDGSIALEAAECLGACGHGPALRIGRHFYEHLTTEKIDFLLESLRRGTAPGADTDRRLEVGP